MQEFIQGGSSGEHRRLQLLIYLHRKRLGDISPPLLDPLAVAGPAGVQKNRHLLIGATRLLPRFRRRLHLDDEVRLASGVIPALVDGTPAIAGMRQLPTS